VVGMHNVGAVEERHDGTEGRDILRVEVHRVETALDVGGERNITLQRKNGLVKLGTGGR
jgi:hypothetical protein